MAVILFYGSDTYSQREKLNFWKTEFEKKYNGDMNTTTFAGKDATARQIFQACSAMPFLSEKRFTVVRNFMSEGDSEQLSQMSDLIEKIPDFCVLVFSEEDGIDKRIGLYKKIQKFGKVTEFLPIAGSKLLAWIEKNVTKAGGQIEREAIVFLSEVVADDLFRLENEIKKLVAYAGDRPITKADIELLVNTLLATSIFKLTDGVGQKNRRLAIDTLHQLMETGEELHMILYMIIRQFRIITAVKDLADQGFGKDSIAAKLKQHPFVIQNTLAQSRNFSFDQLHRAYKLLIEVDTKLKSGGIKILAGDNREFVLALDRLVLDLCG